MCSSKIQTARFGGGTDHGVYRLERAEGKWTSRFVDFGMPAGPDDSTLVEAMVQDKQGVLWVGTGTALLAWPPEGLGSGIE